MKKSKVVIVSTKEEIQNGIRLKKEIIVELKQQIIDLENQLKEVKDEKRESKLRGKDVQPVVGRTRSKV